MQVIKARANRRMITIDTIKDPKANEPTCFNDLHIDREIGLRGYPSSKYQIATAEQVQ